MYKIEVIAHQLRNGKVAIFGDIVSEKELNGNANELVEKGYVSKATEKDLKKAGFTPELTDAQKAELAKKQQEEALAAEIKKLSRMTTAELEEKAKELKVEFTDAHSTNALKAEALEAKMKE